VGGGFTPRSPWLLACNPDRTHYDELDRVIRQTSTAAGRYVIVGVEEPWLNANSASFFAARNRLRTGVRGYYTSLGYAQKDLAAALTRIDDLHATYLVTLERTFQTTPPNFLNLVSLPVLDEIERSTRFRRLPFSSSNGMLIFERLSADEK
jgi:hypothetical protein